MDHMEKILDKENANLFQTMGGTGYPFFMPTYPTIESGSERLVPVKVAYFNGKHVPLIDVNVDVMLRPPKGEKLEDFMAAAGNGIGTVFHPKHYSLGTVLPGLFDSPIQLQAGKRYYFSITTRRGFFVEQINIDQDKNTTTGWSFSECLYRTSDSKLLEGKCPERSK
jgi:hypothetical protein